MPKHVRKRTSAGRDRAGVTTGKVASRARICASPAAGSARHPGVPPASGTMTRQPPAGVSPHRPRSSRAGFPRSRARITRIGQWCARTLWRSVNPAQPRSGKPWESKPLPSSTPTSGQDEHSPRFPRPVSSIRPLSISAIYGSRSAANRPISPWYRLCALRLTSAGAVVLPVSIAQSQWLESVRIGVGPGGHRPSCGERCLCDIRDRCRLSEEGATTSGCTPITTKTTQQPGSSTSTFQRATDLLARARAAVAARGRHAALRLPFRDPERVVPRLSPLHFSLRTPSSGP